MTRVRGSRQVDLGSVPEDARVISVVAEQPLPGGGSRARHYEVAEDGSLREWHYCRPPHEDTVNIDSPATWSCPHPGCGEVWHLEIRTWYCPDNGERDDCSSHHY